MKKSLRFPLIAATAFAGILSTSAAAALPIYVRIAPPVPRAEVRIAAPERFAHYRFDFDCPL